MVSQEDLDVFLARIRRHGGRVSQLASRSSPDAREALLAAMTELEMMYEDLLVADEELRVQGEEMRAAQAALAATRSRYAEMFAAAPVAYAVTTGDGIILEANRAATTLFGNPARGGLGKPLQVYIDMPFRPEMRRLMLNVWREGGIGALDAVVVPRTGRQVDVVLTVGRAIDPQGGANTLRWGLTPATHGFTRSVQALGGDPADRPLDPAGMTAGRDLDHRLVEALFEDASIDLLVVGPDLRAQRASAALTGGKPAAGCSLDELLVEGAEAIGELVTACFRSDRPMRMPVDGRTRAEPDRLRSWTVSVRPLASRDAAGSADSDHARTAVVCLLVDGS